MTGTTGDEDMPVDKFRVTREITIEAPRGEHGEAMRRAVALWTEYDANPEDVDLHNKMAHHRERMTVEVRNE